MRPEKIDAQMKFLPGKIVSTIGVAQGVPVQRVVFSLTRHLRGDWGDVCEEDREANEQALKNGGRLMSVYKSREESQTLWIITEHDRSVTTVLLPSEY